MYVCDDFFGGEGVLMIWGKKEWFFEKNGIYKDYVVKY